MEQKNDYTKTDKERQEANRSNICVDRRMTTQGLTMKDWKVFKDLLVKANSEQLLKIEAVSFTERERRLFKHFGIKE